MMKKKKKAMKPCLANLRDSVWHRAHLIEMYVREDREGVRLIAEVILPAKRFW